MWKLWRTATSFNVRPSQVAGIESTWPAYCFDAAVSLFGNWIEGKLSERNKWGHPRYKLEGLLQEKDEARRFADPRALLKFKR